METKYCNHCKQNFEVCDTTHWRINGRYSQCKIQMLDTHRKWKQRNPTKYSEYAAKYYVNNKEKVIKSNYTYCQKRRKIDPSYNLSILLRQRFGKALKHGSKTGSAVRDLGCTLKEFKLYLESKFQPGMTWENHGRTGWRIDHIKPLSKYDLTNPEELKQVLHYTNLQPLWATDNCRKSNRDNKVA